MKHYSHIKPLEEAVPAERQGAKRHYGVHPYFTRRPFNVVRKYIKHYSREGDVVVDPFGGSGVTAVEAWLENRKGVQNDINPFANFIARGIVGLADGSEGEYASALTELKDKCKNEVAEIEAAGDKALAKRLKKLSLPPDAPLPSTADVDTYHQLFTPRQLAALALIREAVDDIKSRPARNAMLLAWSAALTKLNRTFLSAEGRKDSRGGSSIFSIYRYKVAKNPVQLPAWGTFEERAQNVLAAKEEVDRSITAKRSAGGFRGKFEIYNRDVEELAAQFKGRADYVFTDPPYGGHISYLDLSTLWNVWLGLTPTQKARKSELIVGGELDHSDDLYRKRLGDSVKACLSMLKSGHWLSIVFQHWDVAYFAAILCAAGEAGGDLRAAVSQVGDPIWSMHKKKGSESVLAGEMILTFMKTGKRVGVTTNGKFDVEGEVKRALAAAATGRIYGERLFNRIVVDAWHHGAIDSLNISKTDFAEMIQRHGWTYDEQRHDWVKGEGRLLF